MRRAYLLSLLIFALQAGPAAADVFVNCGQTSLNGILAGLDKRTPITVRVGGLCREYVQIRGHEGLTLMGLPGSALVQPPVVPPGLLLPGVLEVQASRSVTLTGLSVQATDAFGISIGTGSSDIRLRRVSVVGGSYGISVHGASQVSLAGVIVRDPGWAGLGVWDMSAVALEDSLFERTSSEEYRAGLQVGAAVLTLHGTVVRDFQEGLIAEPGGIINVHDISTYAPPGGASDVSIESPAGRGFIGLRVRGGQVSLLSRLNVTNPGQPWGGDTAGVLVEAGGTLEAGPNLTVTGSRGQGLLVTNNSLASLNGSRITGGAHGGLVAMNQATIAVASATPTEVSGNAVDVFCDRRSLVTGGGAIAGAGGVQCRDLLQGPSDPLP